MLPRPVAASRESAANFQEEVSGALTRRRYKTKELRIPLAAQGLLVTLQGFAEALQLVASASLIKVSQRHRTVGGNGLIVTADGFFQLFQTLQRGAFLDQRLRLARLDNQR